MLVPHDIRHPAHGSVTVRKVRIDAPEFRSVVEVRRSHNMSVPVCDAGDELADHYLMTVDGLLFACMRVQHARRGPIDCESCCPARLLDTFGMVIGSSSRLARHADTGTSPGMLRSSVTTVWRDQCDDCMFLDLSNAHVHMVPYYKAMGYESRAGSEFVHTRFGAPSVAMFLIADRTTASSLHKTSESVGNTDMVAKLLRFLRVSQLTSRCS